MNNLPAKNIIEHYSSQLLAQMPATFWYQLESFDQLYFDFPWTLAAWEQMRLHCQHYLLSVLIPSVGRPDPAEFTSHVSLLGFALWWRTEGDELAHLLKIAVHYPGQGDGSLLFAESLGFLGGIGVEKIYLEVHTRNQRAIAFYKKWGAVEFPIKKQFYSSNHPLGAGDARIFGRVILPSNGSGVG